MKIELELPKELYDDLQLCLKAKNIDIKEYLIEAIAISVIRDLKNLYLNDEFEDVE